MIGPDGQQQAPLIATEMDHFFLRVAPVEVLFERNDDGEVVSLTIVQPNGRQTAAKER